MMKKTIYLYNSLTNQKEKFVPINKDKVLMYVCGPTVYDYVHVGNMRPVIVFDTLRRFFEAVGYNVIYVSNYTDVDDRIIEKALKSDKSEKEISEFYIDAYDQTIMALNAKRPTFAPKATEHINGMLDFINTLIAHDAAYENDGEVFFRVKKVPHYGILSNIINDELQVGARIEENTKKEDPHDFLLWKKTEEGIKWDSPWGKGRPGWHTECVVMINDIFKTPLIDIHGGGFDLKFPHHENEIAQSIAYKNTQLANYWLHNGFINLNNQKMAKSTGNVITAKDFVEKYGPAPLRLLLLSTYYRAPVNLNEEIIMNTQNEIDKLRRTMIMLYRYKALNDGDGGNGDAYLEKFYDALADDLNTPNAISELYFLIKEANIQLRKGENSIQNVLDLTDALEKALDVLGLDLSIKKFAEDDIKLLKDYENARKNKDFALSDVLRLKLQDRGLM